MKELTRFKSRVETMRQTVTMSSETRLADRRRQRLRTRFNLLASRLMSTSEMIRNRSRNDASINIVLETYDRKSVV